MKFRKFSNSLQKKPFPERIKIQPRRRFFGFSIIIILLAIVYASLFSSFFSIKHINISGNKLLSEEQLKEKILSALVGRKWYILPENSILFFEVDKIRTALDNPKIQNVEISYDYPNYLNIEITEKISTAAWQSQGRWFELDQDGMIINEIARPSQDQLQITNRNSVQLDKVGDTAISRGELEVIQTIEANFPKLNEVNIILYNIENIKEYKIIAETSENFNLIFSSHVDVMTQLKKLKLFFDTKDREEPGWRKTLEYVDLRFGNTRVYYK